MWFTDLIIKYGIDSNLDETAIWYSVVVLCRYTLAEVFCIELPARLVGAWLQFGVQCQIAEEFIVGTG